MNIERIDQTNNLRAHFGELNGSLIGSGSAEGYGARDRSLDQKWIADGDRSDPLTVLHVFCV
jgi:2-keto-4-pentenoate hydratase/2-oxohepta-3-ene-1,7-dioic acid hydratase in catechol pathway